MTKFVTKCAAATLLAVAPLVALPMQAKAEDQRLTPPLIIDGEVERGIWLYGQVNKGILFADDGNQVNAYPLVDNSNSSTRAGIWFKREFDAGLTFGANLEYEWNPYSTGNVNRNNKGDIDWDTHKMRKAEGVLQSPYGTVWLGQGSMASDGVSEADLSGTALVAYSSVADSAGGQLFTLFIVGITASGGDRESWRRLSRSRVRP